MRKIKRNQLLYRYFQIVVHENTESPVSVVLKLMDYLHGFKRPKNEELFKGAVWFRLLIYRSYTGKITFFIGFPEDRITGVYRMWNMLYPGCELSDIPHSELPLKAQDLPGASIAGGYMRPLQGASAGFAFKEYQGSNDLEDLLYSLGDENDSEAWVDILVSPIRSKIIEKDILASVKSLDVNKRSSTSTLSKVGLSGADFAAAIKGQGNAPIKSQASIKTDMSTETKEKLKALNQRYTGRESVFHCSIQIMVNGVYPDAQLQTIASTIKEMYKMDNYLHLVKKKKPEKFFFQSVPHPLEKIVFTGPELANIFRLPNGKHRIYSRIPHIQAGQRRLGKDELQSGIHIGNVDHPAENKERSVRIPITEILKHFVLTGQTGSGKSSMLMEIMDALIQDFIDNPTKGLGFTLFDPAQETAATVLNRLRFYEKQGKVIDWSKVHYFNFSQDKYVLPMNLLHKDPGESIYSIADEVLELITSAFGPAPQMERITRNSLITLLSDTSIPHSVLGLLPLLTSDRFRRRVIPFIENDYLVSQFWSDEFPDLAQNTKGLIGPLLNRLSPIQTGADTRRMFGHHTMKLQVKKWMDEGHIVLFDIKGLSRTALKMCGGYIANQYHKNAQKRPTGSRAHLLIFDEAHETQYPVLATIQAKDRKHGLSLGLCTQFIDQFEKYLIDNITDNVGNIFSARQGVKSAAIVSKITNSAFDTSTLQGLPDNRIAIYTWSKVNGEKKRATTTVRCAPPFVFKPEGSGEWADYENQKEMEMAFRWGLQRGMSLLKRDGLTASEVDNSIMRYLKTGVPGTNTVTEENSNKKVRTWE